jgi:hypothetical protein
MENQKQKTAGVLPSSSVRGTESQQSLGIAASIQEALQKIMVRLDEIKSRLETDTQGLDNSADQILSANEAAALLHCSKKRLQNLVCEAKRKGRRFDWVLSRGMKRSFLVKKDALLAWMEKQPKGRAGRPPGTPPQ